jgi:ABC-type transporter Mla subunit MlaD
LYALAMAQQTAVPGALTAAAEALERELQRYESLVRDLARERLDSEKALRRAGQVLDNVHECEVRLHAHLAALGEAIVETRDRQEAYAGTVAERSADIAQRTDALAALLDRWKALGDEAAEVSRLVHRVLAAGGANGGDASGDLAKGCEEVDERLSRLADEADALSRSAAAAAFADFAKQAEGLRQQVLSSRNKIRLARGT